VSLSCVCKEFVTLRVLVHKGTHTHTLSLSLSLSVSVSVCLSLGLLGDVLAKQAALVVVLGCLGRGRGSGKGRGGGSIDVVIAETDP
jgi:hypothetical protein